MTDSVKKVISAFLAATTLLFFSCTDSIDETASFTIQISRNSRSAISGISRSYNSSLNANLAIGRKIYFWGITDQQENTTSREFELKAIGNHCRIWYHHNSTLVSIPQTKFAQLAATIDNVFVEETSIFGSNVIPTLIHPTEINVILHSKFKGKGFLLILYNLLV